MARQRLVTEREVRRAIREHAVELDVSGATITPSAIDLAHRLGLMLRGLRGEERLIRRTGLPGVEVRGPRSEVRVDRAPPAATSTADSSSRAPVPQAVSSLRVAVGADHGGVDLKDRIAAHLREKGHSVVDHGTAGHEPVDYPDLALLVARSVSAGAAEVGIIVDGAGIGSCMVANKVRGVRAALCHDVTTATNAREHNNANVLTLGGGLIGPRLALAITDTFLNTPFAGGRHAARVSKIDSLDRA